MHTKEEPNIGRPRCEVAKQATLEAVWRLHSKMPLASISIEGIAREAGVGKATIYRWWPSKAAVAMDAFLLRYLPQVEYPTGGTALQKIERLVTAVAKAYTGEIALLAADLIAEGQSDPSVQAIFNEKFIQPRRHVARGIIVDGIQAGEISADVDPDLALDVLFAPIYFRLLVRRVPADEAFIRDLPKLAMRCLLPQ